MKALRKTKIVGTIGPASENKLEELFIAGLNVCRINYSHGSWDEQSEKSETIMRLREEMDLPIPMLLDMKGPEIRTGMLYTGKNTKIELKDGQKFTLVNEDIIGNEEKVSVTYKELYKDVEPGTKILIDDGAIELKVDEIVGKDIVTTVVHGNGLGSRKTMNLPGTVIRLPGLAEKDYADLKTACEHDYDFVAISFARNAEDINNVRKFLDENGGKDIQIVTKVENVEGLENLDTIIDLADAQMIARGDMATETDFTEPPVVQKRIIKRCNDEHKPAITATQMLESMTHQPLPTRAEVSDVANAIYDRTSAIMLSGECAQGDYPVECVQTMVKIANRIEPEIDYWKRFDEKMPQLNSYEEKANYSACVSARIIKADAIVCYTHTGDTARNLSGFGAGCPILAITDNKRTFRQLALAWNVTPIYVEAKENIDKTIEAGIQKLQDKEILEKGDMVVITGGGQMLPDDKQSKTIGGVLKI
ncbi:MAG TPA: pyruvate kinase [Clostridiales bacterium]|nr:pyruvate kinase [Clostridiales bacterium]